MPQRRVGEIGYKPECMNLWEEADNYMGEDYSDFYVITSKSRDSTLLPTSNYESIKRDFGNLDDIIEVGFGHWAVGHIDALMVDKNAPPEILEKLDEVKCGLGHYPLYDEEDYYRREYEASIENIMLEGNIDRDKAEKVYGYFSDYDDRQLESMDDRGAWIEEDEIDKALKYLFAFDKEYGQAFDFVRKLYGDDGVKELIDSFSERDWETFEKLDEKERRVFATNYYYEKYPELKLSKYHKDQKTLFDIEEIFDVE